MGKGDKKPTKKASGKAVKSVPVELPPWFAQLLASVPVPPSVSSKASGKKRKHTQAAATASSSDDSDASSVAPSSSTGGKGGRKGIAKTRASTPKKTQEHSDQSDGSSAPPEQKSSRKSTARGRSITHQSSTKPAKKRSKTASAKFCRESDSADSGDDGSVSAAEQTERNGSSAHSSDERSDDADEAELVDGPPTVAPAPCLTTRRDVQKYLREQGFAASLFRAPKRSGATFGPVDGAPPDVVVPVRTVLGEQQEAGEFFLLDPDDDLDRAYDKLDGKINLSRLSFDKRLCYVRLLVALARLTLDGKERLRVCMLVNARGLDDIMYLALRVFALDLISAEKTSSDSLMTAVWWYLVVLFMQRQLTMSVGCTRNAPWAVMPMSNENWCKVYRWVELLLVLPLETSALVNQLLHQEESISAQFLGGKVSTAVANDPELVKKWWAFRFRASQLGKVGSIRTHEMDVVPGYRTYWLSKFGTAGQVAKIIAAAEQQEGADAAAGSIMKTVVTLEPARYTECLFATAALLTTRLGTNKDQRADRQRLDVLCRELRVSLPSTDTFTFDYSGNNSAMDKVIKQIAQFSLQDSQALAGSSDELHLVTRLAAPANLAEELRITLPIQNLHALRNEWLRNVDTADTARDGNKSGERVINGSQQMQNEDEDARNALASSRPLLGLPSHVLSQEAAATRQYSSPVRRPPELLGGGTPPKLLPPPGFGATTQTDEAWPDAVITVDAASDARTPERPKSPVAAANSTTTHLSPERRSRGRVHTTSALLDVYTATAYDLDAMRASLRQNARAASSDALGEVHADNQLIYLLELIQAHSLQFPLDKVLVTEACFWEGPYVRPNTFFNEQLQQHGLANQRVVLGTGLLKAQPFLVAIFAARDFTASYTVLQYAPTIVLFVETRVSNVNFELLVKCIHLRLAASLRHEYGSELGDWVQPVIMRCDVASPKDQFDSTYLFERFAVHAAQLLIFSLFPTAVYFRLDLFDLAPTCDTTLRFLHQLYDARQTADGHLYEATILRDWINTQQEACTTACTRQGFVELYTAHTAQMFAMFVRAWSLFSTGDNGWVEYLLPNNVSEEFVSATTQALDMYNHKLCNDLFFGENVRGLKRRQLSGLATAETKRRLQRCGFQCMRQLREIAVFENPDGLHIIVTEDGHKMLHFRKTWTISDLLKFTRATLSYSVWAVGTAVWRIERSSQ